MDTESEQLEIACKRDRLQDVWIGSRGGRDSCGYCGVELLLTMQ